MRVRARASARTASRPPASATRCSRARARRARLSRHAWRSVCGQRDLHSGPVAGPASTVTRESFGVFLAGVQKTGGRCGRTKTARAGRPLRTRRRSAPRLEPTSQSVFLGTGGEATTTRCFQSFGAEVLSARLAAGGPALSARAHRRLHRRLDGSQRPEGTARVGRAVGCTTPMATSWPRACPQGLGGSRVRWASL